MANPNSSYTDSVPHQLHPASVRHHIRLLDWTLFRFSLLKFYLSRTLGADYATRRANALVSALALPEIGNLLLMSAMHGLLASVVLVGGVSLLQGTAIRWPGFGLGILAGVMSGLLIGIFSFRSLGLGVSTATVSVWLAAGVPTFGIAGGVQPGVLWLVTLLAVSGFSLIQPLGVARAALSGDDRVLAYGIVVGVAVGILAGTTLSIIIFAPGAVAGGLVLVAALMSILALGSSRIIIYWIELLWAVISDRVGSDAYAQAKRHPGFWDENMVFPAFGLDTLLVRVLVKDVSQGLSLTRYIVTNSLQRWIIQRAFTNLLERAVDPVALLYSIILEPRFRESVVFRVNGEGSTDAGSVRQVLLAELAGRIPHTSSQITDQVAYYYTNPFRNRRVISVHEFAGLLHALLDMNLVNSSSFVLRSWQPHYESLTNLPHGLEISQSFSTLAEYLEWSNIEQLTRAGDYLAWTDSLTDTLRPEVIRTLEGLAEVGAEVTTFQVSTSRMNRLAALSRATAGLEVLAKRVADQFPMPETNLLLRVIRQWQSLVAQASGRLGAEALREMLPQARQVAQVEGRQSVIWQRPVTPIPNPFQAGAPVYPPLFVGRKDIFDRIGQVWLSKKNPDSIILYGHRRMGKTSILRNLDQVAPSSSILVYLDLKGETSFVQNTAELLLGIADTIHSVIQRSLPDFGIPAPSPTDYANPAAARFQLDHFLRQLQTALAGRRLILTLDEFEAIQDAVHDRRIGQEIYQYLRAKTQEPWITMVFAGLHTLDEMSREYQEPFYGSYVNICISYLSDEAARRLITNPVPDFQVDYDAEVVEAVIRATCGQPMLVQYICQELINRLNHELFDLNIERELRISQRDLATVLTDDFIRHETRYFDGVWSQVKSMPEQAAVLVAMARSPEGGTVADLAESTGLGSDVVHRALEDMRRRDILAPLDNNVEHWRFLVPLMRRWIVLTGK